MLVLAVATLGADGAQASKRKNAIKDWVQEVVPGDGNQPVDVACRTLEKRMQKQIGVMKSINVQIASAGSGPPPTLFALLESFSGQRSESAAAKSARLRLSKERKSAEQLNDLLRLSNCPTVDIDRAIAASGNTAAKKAPDTGDSLKQRQMDDLVRSPY